MDSQARLRSNLRRSAAQPAAGAYRTGASAMHRCLPVALVILTLAVGATLNACTGESSAGDRGTAVAPATAPAANPAAAAPAAPSGNAPVGVGAPPTAVGSANP